MHFTPLKLSHMYYNIIIRVAHKTYLWGDSWVQTFTRMFKSVSWEELSENLFLGDLILLTLKEPIWVFLTLSQLEHNVKQ